MQQDSKAIAYRRRHHWSLLLFLLISSLEFIGCHSIISNEAEWSRPVVVPVSAETLDGAKVMVECRSDLTLDPEFGAPRVKGCNHLSQVIKNMGAKVYTINQGTPIPVENEDDGDDDFEEDAAKPDSVTKASNPRGKPDLQPDFILVFVSGSAKRDFCGWTVVPFILSFTLFPCVEDVVSRAELRIMDGAGHLRERRPLHVDSTNIYGIPALYYIAIDAMQRPEDPEAVTARRQQQFLDYVRSFVAGYWTRELLARKSYAGAAT